MDTGISHVSLPPPPLPIAEIERRIAICETCPKYLPARRGCTICKTCGSGMAIYEGLLKDPTKRCPWPEPLGGSKWGEPLPPPLRVAFLTPGLTCGGAERWIVSLCQNFDPAKVWVQAIGVEGAMHIDPMMREQVPKHIRIVTEWDNILPVAKAVDLLIVWGSPGMIDLAKASGKPFIVVVHGADATSAYGGAIARKGIEAGGLAACVNEACLACYPEEYRGRVTVIPNGADEDRVKPTTKNVRTKLLLEMFPLPDLPETFWEASKTEVYKAECEWTAWEREHSRKKFLLYLGRVMKDKYIDKLRAVAEALPPEWVTVCAGTADAFGRGQIGGRLRLVEPRNHVGDLLAAADVQILLSPSEAYPLSIAEGWLAGVPTVVSELPWIESIHRKHGPLSWMVPKDASAEQAAAIVLEADAAGRWSEQVLYAQEVARLEYTTTAMCRRWEVFLISQK